MRLLLRRLHALSAHLVACRYRMLNTGVDLCDSAIGVEGTSLTPSCADVPYVSGMPALGTAVCCATLKAVPFTTHASSRSRLASPLPSSSLVGARRAACATRDTQRSIWATYFVLVSSERNVKHTVTD
uniref:Uncharacterized protein n=1 Tax=Strombidinopsis acuminata TaxID=141414 RepID=A0A7S3RDM8_9SPIT|mmetsp:Transcript_13465/g.40855  ORF Transcript_13465/g.40855 Transcript_13465/m.40855 type:complete len:128 (-) Transcript_13465:352-735(-)|eukprot:scaffold138325_cov32-Tisochrysis_lutea.AAC.2